MSVFDFARAEDAGSKTTTSTSYVRSGTGLVFDGALDLTTGRTYLVLAHGLMRAQVALGRVGVHLVHGATEFAGSEQLLSPLNLIDWHPWTWAGLWTHDGVSDLAVEIKSDGVAQCEFRWGSLVALDVTDQVAAGDVHTSELGTSHVLTTTPFDGASVTFTPSAAQAGSWLVLTSARLTVDSTANSFATRLRRSGEASSTTPDALVQGRAVGDALVLTQARLCTLTAAANTFTEQSSRVGTNAATAARTRSFVLAFRVDLCETAADLYQDGETDLDTSWLTLQSVSYEPATTGAALFLLQAVPDLNQASKFARLRPWLDNTEFESQYDSAVPRLMVTPSGNTTEHWPCLFVYSRASVANTSAHPVTIRGECQSPTQAGKGAKHLLTLGLSMQLAPGGGPGGGGAAHGGVFRNRRRRN